MARRNAALVFGTCFALAACADARNRSITSPGDEASLEVGAGPADVLTPIGSDESIALAGEVGIEQAATGGRASGHFELDAPFLGVDSEQYSFVALSTADFPNAKGQMQATITRTTSIQRIHAEVDCLAISGNEARISGVITKLVRNGVPQPPGGHVVWRVQDNGEGANSPPDLGSLLFVGFPQACQVQLFLPMTPTANGNIQVSQR